MPPPPIVSVNVERKRSVKLLKTLQSWSSRYEKWKRRENIIGGRGTIFVKWLLAVRVMLIFCHGRFHRGKGGMPLLEERWVWEMCNTKVQKVGIAMVAETHVAVQAPTSHPQVLHLKHPNPHNSQCLSSGDH
jgi:hypothetical protein